MSSSSNYHGVRFSLRGLLAMVTFFAVACAALKFANAVWWLAVSSAALLLLMAMTIVALVDRRPRRAFAIGFLCCIVVYSLLMYVEGEKKYGASSDQLPLLTTRQLMWMYEVVKRESYLDNETGEPLVGFDPSSDGGKVMVRDNSGYFAVYVDGLDDGPIISGSGGGGYGDSGGYGGPVTKVVRVTVAPNSRSFMLIGHLLWAVILGFIGGQFARFVYAKSERQAELADRAAEHS